MLNSESYDVWHGILGHANFKFIQKIFNVNLIPKSKIDYKFKYEIYAQSKQTKKYFKSIFQRNTQLLKLIHSDVFDSYLT